MLIRKDSKQKYKPFFQLQLVQPYDIKSYYSCFCFFKNIIFNFHYRKKKTEKKKKVFSKFERFQKNNTFYKIETTHYYYSYINIFLGMISSRNDDGSTFCRRQPEKQKESLPI
jgi:hypothetical protein